MPSGERLPGPLGALESTVLDACAGREEWPAQVAAGINAGVDFVICNSALAETWLAEMEPDQLYRSHYEPMITRLAGLIRYRAPVDSRLPVSPDEALVAGIVGLVGDHVRLGRLDRLAALKPELVQLALLPYLGFAESQEWANRSAEWR